MPEQLPLLNAVKPCLEAGESPRPHLGADPRPLFRHAVPHSTWAMRQGPGAPGFGESDRTCRRSRAARRCERGVGVCLRGLQRLLVGDGAGQHPGPAGLAHSPSGTLDWPCDPTKDPKPGNKFQSHFSVPWKGQVVTVPLGVKQEAGWCLQKNFRGTWAGVQGPLRDDGGWAGPHRA